MTRRAGLDALKAIAALMVVCIHCPFPGIFGRYADAISRCAVPIFFMITGFFYDDMVKRRRAGRQMGKILLLLIEGCAAYLVWQCLKEWIYGRSIPSYISYLTSGESWFRLIAMNEPRVASHLWYLDALLYVLLIVAAADRFHLRRLLCALGALLLLMQDATLILLPQTQPIQTRNFLLLGLPYFCIGTMLRPWLEGRPQISKKRLAVLAVAGAALTLVEWYLLNWAGYAPGREHYASTTLLAISLFLLFDGSECWSGKIGRCIAYIGRECSAWVYVIHWMIMEMLLMAADAWGIRGIFAYVAPLAIYAVTVLLVAAAKHAAKRRRLRA